MRAPGELLRFGVVGVVSNVLLYLLYLALTAAGAGHKAAMTGVYCLGVLQTYAANQRWTFGLSGGPRAFARYWVVYGACYLLNLGLLVLLVDMAGLAHQPVQAFIIVLVALLTFLMQKHWVFRG